MDKYLQSSSKKSETKPVSCLEALKNAQRSSNSIQKPNSSTSTVLSTFDLACERNRQQADTRNFVGWKSTYGGRKVYTTFRNQHKVSAEGAEGFRLALTDGKAKAKRKAKDLENEPDVVQVHAVQKSTLSKRQKNVVSTNSSTVVNSCDSHQTTNTASNNSLGSFFRK